MLDEKSAGALGCDAFTGLLREAFGDSATRSLLVEVVMRQGAKREVRRLLKAAGLRTIRLTRVAVGEVGLDGLASGGVRQLDRPEVLGLYAGAFAGRQRADGGGYERANLPPIYDAEAGGWVLASELR